ncbi:MAG: hypothetical protein ACYS0H_05960, partial [Planctomycetota bacterium]
MKTVLQICVLGCILALSTGAYGSEFNADGYREGWTRARTTIDVNDGYLLVNVPADTANVHIIPPPGPYDGNEITGLYAKMQASKDVSSLAGTKVRFFVGQTGKNQAFQLAGDPNQSEVVYVDLASNANWSGKQIDAFGLYLPHNAPEAYQMKIDWIRLEGLYLDNESFEYWDNDNDTILGWSADAGYGFPDPMDPNDVSSRTYAAVLTGTGTGQTIKQAIKRSSEMAKGQQLMLAAAFKVPAAAAADTIITLTISEDGSTEGTVIAVDAVDAYFEGTAVYTLQQEAVARQSLEAQVTIQAPDGAVIYVDDVFVGVLPEPVDPNLDIQYGWPVNCVKLAAGQEITI